MRKFLFVLFIVSTHLLTMEQPASTPVVPQVPTYTLIGNDGQQVHIARNLIQQFAPGLAEKFTASGFKEAQTGQIILADLDGHALQHFKELLEQTAALFVIISKQIDEIVKRSEQELEKVPEGQLEQENKLKAEIIAEGFAQSKAITANIVTRIVKIMEELPKIGEHFLNLFNSIVQWRVPYILESAFGKFAVQHLNLVDDENFKQLTDRSFAPRAQLLYLNNLEFNVINCVKAYELLSLLLQNPAATADKQNKELLDTVENTLIQFTVTNIQEILRKQPQFRTFLIRPDAEQIAGILRTQIIEFYAPTFEKKIMDVPLLAELYPIDNKRVMVTQTYSTNDDFIVDLSNGKTVPLKKDNRHVVNYIFWGPNKLIQVCSTRIEEKIRNSIYFYNLDTGAVLDFIDISHQYGIYRVNTIDENRFIFSQKSSDDFFHDNIYLYDLKKPQRNRIQQILKISSFQSDIVALNERQLLICSADPAPDQPPLYIFDLNAHHKTHSWPYRFSNIISIDKAYYWLMFYDSRSYKEFLLENL